MTFEEVSVLLISPFESDQRAMAAIFHRSRWSLAAARDLAEAQQMLRHRPPSIIVTEICVPGGDWRAVVSAAAGCAPVVPRVIVASRLADDGLWQKVLDAGGYDVIEKPFEAESIFLTVSQAWRHWRADWTRECRVVEGLNPLPIEKTVITLAAS